MTADSEKAASIVWEIAPLLAGKDPAIQGAVLANLVAIWIAGHVALRDEKATKSLWEELLDLHVEHVCKFILLEAKRIGTNELFAEAEIH